VFCSLLQSQQPRLGQTSESEQIEDDEPQPTSQTQQKVEKEQVSNEAMCQHKVNVQGTTLSGSAAVETLCYKPEGRLFETL
jgi:hypothetical protein